MNFFILMFFQLAFAHFELPNTPESGIGDMGSLYLAKPDTFTFHVMNNDFIGDTDKLMTGSMTLIYYQSLKNLTFDDGEVINRGLSYSINRKIITPVLRTKFNKPSLANPKGIYADWLELKSSYSQNWNKWKFEIGLSVDDLGNFSGKGIQSKFHQILGSDDETDKYGELSRGTFGGGSIGVGYKLNTNLLLMAYFQKNELMQDWEGRISYVNNYDDLNYGFQANLVSQQYSDLYSEITDNRYGWALSVKYKWWQLNFGYISKYLKYDDYGQFFIDPLIINFKF